MSALTNSDSFVASVRPLLESKDVHGLVGLLNSRWNSSYLTDLLLRPDTDARKVSLLCLGLVGDRESIPTVAAQLRHDCPTMVELAEHALWSIWFRCGSPTANSELCRGAKCLAQRNLDGAVEHFDRAIEISPDFAEPYNQRAIVRFLNDDFEQSIADCRKVIRLMPCHFGALAGMGHCFLHLGQMDHAQKSYERALAVHPHLSAVRESLDAIRRPK